MSDQISGWLREIDAVAEDVFDLAAREQAKKKAGSRRNAYEKGLREVRRIAGDSGAQELADWIGAEMREDERFPSARQVRKQGARICRESGHEISASDWLGA